MQVGFKATEELKSAFAAAQDSNVAFLKLDIDNDGEFIVVDTQTSTGSKEKDFKLAARALVENIACFLVLRVDDKWCLIAYVPNSCSVRQRTLFSSSRAELKFSLGASKFVDDFFIQDKSECTLSNYTASASARPDLESIMREDERLKYLEAKETAPVSTRAAAMASLLLRIDSSAESALTALSSNPTSAIAALFFLETKTQTLSGQNFVFDSAEQIAAKLPDSSPCYALFRFPHERERQLAYPIVYYYYIPDKSDRTFKMVYAACKRDFLSVLEQRHLTPAKSIEISERTELTRDYLMNELYPRLLAKDTFAKPQAPKARGARPRPAFPGGGAQAGSPSPSVSPSPSPSISPGPGAASTPPSGP